MNIWARKTALFSVVSAIVIAASPFAVAVPLPPNYKYPKLSQRIIAELEVFPRPGPFKFHELPIVRWPEFDTRDLQPYDADYPSLEALRGELEKNPAKHPLRAAVLQGIKSLEDARFPARDAFPLMKLTPQVKQAILKEQ